MKTRYWVALVLALIVAFFVPLAATIREHQTLRREALAAAGDDLPYQILVYQKGTDNCQGIFYTNDYKLSAPTCGEDNCCNLYMRWAVTWRGDRWTFILDPSYTEDVLVVVNTGDAIR